MLTTTLNYPGFFFKAPCIHAQNKKKVLHVFWQDRWIEMRWIIDFMSAFCVTEQDAHLSDILLLKRLNWNNY